MNNNKKLYTIYTRDICSFCDMAKGLMTRYGLSYDEYNIESHPHFKEELMKAAPGATTVPQIFVGEKLIGGYTDFVQYAEDCLGQYGEGSL
jgi:glutaredoxin 3|tara:strand:- start:731 stop:1003 length:273 start_codon:yes stop_codon:yes gene_type:complete